MTTHPYSDQWREHTRARMFTHGVHAETVAKRTGLGQAGLDAIREDIDVSAEVMGPIDEFLDALDDGTETANSARAMTVPGHAPEVRPVFAELGSVVDVGALADCDVVLWGKP